MRGAIPAEEFNANPKDLGAEDDPERNAERQSFTLRRSRKEQRHEKEYGDQQKGRPGQAQRGIADDADISQSSAVDEPGGKTAKCDKEGVGRQVARQQRWERGRNRRPENNSQKSAGRAQQQRLRYINP